jgi:fumarate hydratase class II
MDATPITLGQEISGYAAQLNYGIKALQNTLPHLSEIALEEPQLVGLNTPQDMP